MKTTCFIAVFVLSSCCNLLAASINLIERQPQESKGQDFTFNFEQAPRSNGNGGTFVVHAAGDYVHQGFISTEHLFWNIEGVVSDGPVGHFDGCDPRFDNRCTTPTVFSSAGGPFDFVNYSGGIGSIEFQRTYDLTPTQLDAILADGRVNIFVDLGTAVDGGQFVEVALNYVQIPEPSTAVLLLTCIVPAFIRRRR